MWAVTDDIRISPSNIALLIVVRPPVQWLFQLTPTPHTASWVITYFGSSANMIDSVVAWTNVLRTCSTIMMFTTLFCESALTRLHWGNQADIPAYVTVYDKYHRETSLHRWERDASAGKLGAAPLARSYRPILYSFVE